MYVRMLIAIVLLSMLGHVVSDRCRTDAEYSYQICSAIRTIIQNQECDMREVERLRIRVSYLEGLLSAVIREKNAREANKPQTNCTGLIYGQKCYFILDDGGTRNMKSLQEAQNACESQQGTLAYIDGSSKYETIEEYIKTTAKDFVSKSRKLVLVWTGATYQNGQIYVENNRENNFAAWGSFYPINDTERNRIGLAVATNQQFSGMFNAQPTLKLYPLCQKRHIS